MITSVPSSASRRATASQCPGCFRSPMLPYPRVWMLLPVLPARFSSPVLENSEIVEAAVHVGGMEDEKSGSHRPPLQNTSINADTILIVSVVLAERIIHKSAPTAYEDCQGRSQQD